MKSQIFHFHPVQNLVEVILTVNKILVAKPADSEPSQYLI